MPSLLRRILAPLARATSPRISAASSGHRTVEVDPRAVRDLVLRYAPAPDGTPDAGEVVWTWVPFAERDGRGKDRPVLVIAPLDSARAYAVKLTSRSHDGDREFLPLGPGPWDAAGRASWVDLDQLYIVHEGGMRREGAALDRARYVAVAAELARRYEWRVA